jgi:hypothetical protein
MGVALATPLRPNDSSAVAIKRRDTDMARFQWLKFPRTSPPFVPDPSRTVYCL